MVRNDIEEAQRLVETVIVVPTILVVLTTANQAQTVVDSLNPTLVIMNVVHDINAEVREEVSTPAIAQTIFDSDIALATQFDTMN